MQSVLNLNGFILQVEEVAEVLNMVMVLLIVWGIHTMLGAFGIVSI
jgi:hypothetical protein